MDMQVWGIVRSDDDFADAESTLITAAGNSGWSYLGTLVRHGLDRLSLVPLVHAAHGQPLLVAGNGTLAGDPREAALRILILEHLGSSVILAEDWANDALQVALDASRERLRPSENIRTGMQARALRGLSLGRLPYGYVKGEGGQPAMEDDEAVTVRLIFELCLSGKGIRAISAELNARGLRTRRGGAWSMITVRDMLRNRFYTGTYDRFGMRVSGNHPAMVTREVFTQVQERMDAAARRSGHGKGAPFLLAGLLECGYCGGNVVGVTRRQRWQRKDGTDVTEDYRYYQCGSRTNQGRCGYHSRRAEELENEIAQQLEERLPEDESSAEESLAAEVTRVSPVLERIVRRAVRDGLTSDQARHEAKGQAGGWGEVGNGRLRHVRRVVLTDDGVTIDLR